MTRLLAEGPRGHLSLTSLASGRNSTKYLLNELNKIFFFITKVQMTKNFITLSKQGAPMCDENAH